MRIVKLAPSRRPRLLAQWVGRSLIAVMMIVAAMQLAPERAHAAAAHTINPPPSTTGSWTYCATEGGVCSVNTGGVPAAVAYGAYNSSGQPLFYYGNFSAYIMQHGLSCSNSTFGDPAYTYTKACYYSTTIPSPAASLWSPCSNEFQTCYFSGTKTVAFGANGHYAYKLLTNNTACSTSVFGDPAYGYLKTCYLDLPSMAGCGHGLNATSSACLDNSQSDLYTAAFGEWPNSNMYLDSSHYSQGYHINNEMWVYNTADRAQWVEFGLHNGIPVGNDPCLPNCVAYELFWAEFDSNNAEHDHYLANLTPDNSYHTYQILSRNDGSNQWDLYYDGTYRASSTLQTSSLANEYEVGLELSRANLGDIGPWSHADPFNNINLETADASGHWQLFPYLHQWVDNPCGSNPQGYCLDGSSPYSARWQDDKP